MISERAMEKQFTIFAAASSKGDELPFFEKARIDDFAEVGAHDFLPYIYRIEEYIESATEQDITSGRMIQHLVNASTVDFEDTLFSGLLYAAGAAWISIFDEIPELKNERLEMPRVLQAGFLPERAVEQLKNKLPISKEEFKLISDQMRHRAFTIARWNKLHLLDNMRDSLVTALKEGQGFGQWKKGAKEIIGKSGWTPANKQHLRLVFQNNMLSAYAAQRYQGQKAASKFRPYLQRKAVSDSRTRPTHAQMDGLVYPFDHDFWLIHYPPDDHGCRCYAISLSARQVANKGLKVQEAIPENLQNEGWMSNPALGPLKLGRDDIENSLAEMMIPWEPAGFPKTLTQIENIEQWESLSEVLENHTPDGTLEQANSYYWKKFKKLWALKNKNDVVTYIDANKNAVEISWRSYNHLVTEKDEKTLSKSRMENCKNLPMTRLSLLDPEEMWLTKVKNDKGDDAWRRYYLRCFESDKKRVVGVVVQAQPNDYGLMWNFIQSSKLNRFNNQIRVGIPLYRKDDNDE